MATTRMSVQDALWLTMDRPNNLMVVDGVVMLAGVPDFDDVRATFAKAVARFPVLARRPERRGNSWYWVDDPDFDLDDHLHHVTLTDGGGTTEVQDFAAQQRSEPIDKDHPLWAAFFVSPVALDDGSVGAAVITRFHHAIADGVRLTQVLLSMCDPVEGVFVPPVAREGVEADWLDPIGTVTSAAKEGARFSVAATQATFDRLGGAASSAVRVTRERRILSAVASIPRVGWDGLVTGVDLLRHPDRLVDALETLGLLGHRSLNNATSVTKLLLTEGGETVWTGTPGREKRMTWSPPFPLAEVKGAAKAHGATVNDVLLAGVAGGLRRYLEERDAVLDEVVWMVPVNLKPFEDNLPEDLGNYFALVMLAMPLGQGSRSERLDDMHHRMQRIKHSDEAVITFGLQRSLSVSPATIASHLTDFFANKAVGILTNVPGPTGPMTFAGADVSQVMGFAPCSGDQPMTATIFSYNGAVTVGFAADAALVDDLPGLVGLVVEEVHALCALG